MIADEWKNVNHNDKTGDSFITVGEHCWLMDNDDDYRKAHVPPEFEYDYECAKRFDVDDPKALHENRMKTDQYYKYRIEYNGWKPEYAKPCDYYGNPFTGNGGVNCYTRVSYSSDQYTKKTYTIQFDNNERK